MKRMKKKKKKKKTRAVSNRTTSSTSSIDMYCLSFGRGLGSKRIKNDFVNFVLLSSKFTMKMDTILQESNTLNTENTDIHRTPDK